MKNRTTIIVLIVIAAAIGLGIYFYLDYKHDQEMRHPKFYSGNGRLESTEVYVAAKLTGRIDKLYVDEGDLVRKGDKLVDMQTNTLLADKAVAIAKIKVKEGELAMAKANVIQRQSEFDGAEKEYKRQSSLIKTNATSQKHFDSAETNYNSAKANLEYAKASVIAAEGSLAQQKAEVKRIDADLDDSYLYAKYDGRIQYVLAREGEVLNQGGRVLNQVNLTDSYLTFFLPTEIAGKVQMGAEVKLIFDAIPDHSFNAKVTFIDPSAQFTPKTVETKLERTKLMFRIKAHLNAEMLRKYIDNVKTGLPGIAWVKLDPDADWSECPEKIPQDVSTAMAKYEAEKNTAKTAKDSEVKNSGNKTK